MTTSPPALQIKLSELAGIVDMRSFYERHGCIVSDKPTNSPHDGKEYASSCPRCGGENRFSFWDSGRFNCIRGCDWHGSSPYYFLRDQGYSHIQALAELDIDPAQLGDSYSQSNGNRSPLPLFLIKDEAPCIWWQDTAAAFCRIAEKCLWSEQGKTARNYLQSRGLTEQTIRLAHLGLCPDWQTFSLSEWGLAPEQLGKDDETEIKIPKGIVIPWYVGNDIWKVQIRRPVPGPDGSKYREITGSSECLYNSNSIQPGQPVLLVESELDALSTQQEAGDLIACVATGSTSKALSGRNLIPLIQADHVLQSFDDDRAGECGAAEWIETLGEEKCERWAPWSHDVNDMLTSGLSIRSWVEAGLAAGIETSVIGLLGYGDDTHDTHNSHDTKVANSALSTDDHTFDINGKFIPPELLERVKLFQQHPCAGCGGYDWFVDFDGRLTCPCIIPKRIEATQPRPVTSHAMPTNDAQNFFLQNY